MLVGVLEREAPASMRSIGGGSMSRFRWEKHRNGKDKEKMGRQTGRTLGQRRDRSAVRDDEPDAEPDGL